MLDGWAKRPESEAFGNTHMVQEVEDGRIFVHHTGPKSIHVYDPDGKFITAFGHIADGAAWASRWGLLNPLSPFGDTIGVAGAASEEKKRVFGAAAHNRWAAEEANNWQRTAAQARAAAPFPPRMPVGVVLAVPGLYLLAVTNRALRALGSGANAFRLTSSVVQERIYASTRNPMSLAPAGSPRSGVSPRSRGRMTSASRRTRGAPVCCSRRASMSPWPRPTATFWK